MGILLSAYRLIVHKMISRTIVKIIRDLRVKTSRVKQYLIRVNLKTEASRIRVS